MKLYPRPGGAPLLPFLPRSFLEKLNEDLSLGCQLANQAVS